MPGKTKIEWSDRVWNVVTGCDKVSPGCKNCYAETMAMRLQAMGQRRYKDGFKLTLQSDLLTEPLKWKKPSKIFVNSMSDLFHEGIPIDFLQRIFKTMNEANWHTFQILTKRAEYLLEVANKLAWTPNIWMGVSVENSDYLWRIDNLLNTPAQIKFLSLEPLLGPLPYLDLYGIDWCIVGGESSAKARPMKKEWVTEIRDKCIDRNVPFFFKQWGGVKKWKNGRELEGKIWNQMPEIKKVFSIENDLPF